MTISLLRRITVLALVAGFLLSAGALRGAEEEKEKGKEKEKKKKKTQEEQVEGKKKEGRYFLELGEIFYQSDDFGVSAGEEDPDGLAGPAGLRKVDVPADDFFQTNPYVSMGYVFPSGKFVASLTEMQFNDQSGTSPDVTIGGYMEDHLGIPGLTMYRTGSNIPPANPSDPVQYYEVPNPITGGDITVDREYRYFDANLSQNLWQNKKFLLRIDYGLRYLQLQERIYAEYQYQEEQLPLGSPNLLYKWNDLQTVQANSDTKMLGPKVGLNARLGLGKKSRWTLKGGFSVMAAQESNTLRYRAQGFELNPYNLNLGAILDPTQTVSGYAWSPGGVADRELGTYSVYIRDNSADSILFSYEAFFRVEFSPANYITMGLGYDLLGLQNFVSAREAIDRVNANLTDIRMDRQGYGDTDPKNNQTVTLYSWNGVPYSGSLTQDARPPEAEISGRRDFAFEGLRFYLRFNF